MKFQIMPSGDVLDTETGLIWRRPIDSRFSFDDALIYAQTVSEETGLPWRVASANELLTLVNYDACEPASDFPDMPEEFFWTSSTYLTKDEYHEDGELAWTVYFLDGTLEPQCKEIFDFPVMLVRDK